MKFINKENVLQKTFAFGVFWTFILFSTFLFLNFAAVISSTWQMIVFSPNRLKIWKKKKFEKKNLKKLFILKAKNFLATNSLHKTFIRTNFFLLIQRIKRITLSSKMISGCFGIGVTILNLILFFNNFINSYLWS